MNSLLLLLLLLALIVIFLYSDKNGEMFSGTFYPKEKNMILDNCELEYMDCLLDDTGGCSKDKDKDVNIVLKTVYACKDKPVKIFTDMIYGNEYIFIEKPYSIDDDKEIPLDNGIILVRFPNTLPIVPHWFNVGTIDQYGYTLKKLYSNLNSDKTPTETQIKWTHNEPIVFIHRQKIERLNLLNITSKDEILYYTIRNKKILFVKVNLVTPKTIKSVKEYDLNGTDTDTKNLTTEPSILHGFFTDSTDTEENLEVFKIIKTSKDGEDVNTLTITNENPQMNKINSKTLYYNGENGWKQTYNPSDFYIDKNITLLSMLYVNNNDIKNLEQEMDKLIEQIN
jgi:hypothetical protein